MKNLKKYVTFWENREKQAPRKFAQLRATSRKFGVLGNFHENAEKPVDFVSFLENCQKNELARSCAELRAGNTVCAIFVYLPYMYIVFPIYS